MSKQKINLTFGKRLNQLMIDRGLSVSKVSKLTGVNRRRINEYLNFEKEPKTTTLIKICKGLDVSSDWLLKIE